MGEPGLLLLGLVRKGWDYHSMLSFGQLAAFSLTVGVIFMGAWYARRACKAPRDFFKGVPDEFMATIVSDSRDGVVIQNMNAQILWANSSWCDLFQYDLEDVLGKNPLSLVIPERNKLPEEEIANFKYDLSSGFLDEYEIVRNCRSDGSELWTALSFSYHKLSSGEERIAVFCRDITEAIEREQQLKKTNEVIAFRADHDALTAVANREKLDRFFEETRANAIKSGQQYGLLHIDLDYFKTINDSFGHSAGDAVIIKAADRMRTVVGPSDLLARIGGDEFVVVCPDISDFSQIKTRSEKIIDLVSRPINWEDRLLKVGASIGASLSSTGAPSYEQMMQQADIALYEAKNRGRGQVACYDEAMDRSHVDRMRLSSELVEALEKDQLCVYLQPQFSLIAKSVNGFEALVRWHHPTRGVLAPDNFLDAANDIGIIEEIDRLAATQAFEALRRLHASGHTGLHISLNVSESSFANGNYTDFLKWEADRNQLEPEQITVEILETTFLSDTDKHPEQMIQALSKAGFRVELDDFGTGYAGLSHLGRLRVDGVKIDKSMIQNLSEDVTNQIIVEAMVALSSDLGLRVVAEGVANTQDALTLRQFGCTNVQGDGISEPLPLDEVERWLDETDMNAILTNDTDAAKSEWAEVS